MTTRRFSPLRHSFALAAAACVLTCAERPAALAQTPEPALTPTPAPSLLETVATDPADIIQAHVGQTFTIALRANRTTGFSWQLAQPPGDGVKVLGSACEERSSLIGGGGQELWLFSAVAAGSASIALRYVRPFAKGSAQMERALTFRVEILP